MTTCRNWWMSSLLEQIVSCLYYLYYPTQLKCLINKRIFTKWLEIVCHQNSTAPASIKSEKGQQTSGMHPHLLVSKQYISSRPSCPWKDLALTATKCTCELSTPAFPPTTCTTALQDADVQIQTPYMLSLLIPLPFSQPTDQKRRGWGPLEHTHLAEVAASEPHLV